jgi:hypothetical protein
MNTKRVPSVGDMVRHVCWGDASGPRLVTAVGRFEFLTLASDGLREQSYSIDSSEWIQVVGSEPTEAELYSEWYRLAIIAIIADDADHEQCIKVDAAAELQSEWNRLDDLAAIAEDARDEQYVKVDAAKILADKLAEEAILAADAEDEAWVKLNDHRKKNHEPKPSTPYEDSNIEIGKKVWDDILAASAASGDMWDSYEDYLDGLT